MITRAYEPLDAYLRPNKALLIYGPRRVGKTTLLRNYLAHTPFRYKLDSGDNIRTQQVLGSQSFSQIMDYVEGYDLLAIDEAQNIPHIGMGLKILVDQVRSSRVLWDLLRLRAYTRLYANEYFWRTYDQQEIDLVEEREGQLFGYECKWSTTSTPVPPRDWLSTYPNATFTAITPQNYQEWVLLPRPQ